MIILQLNNGQRPLGQQFLRQGARGDGGVPKGGGRRDCVREGHRKQPKLPEGACLNDPNL
ncbi:MAG: hypothetical protein ACJAVR_001195, partial [Paracoccaceae bacterium]